MRPLHPGELARHDQALAAAKNEAHTAGLAVVFIDFADDGAPCGMCDCLPDPASHDETWCAGCPRDASTVFRVFPGALEETAAAVCAHHREAAGTILFGAIRQFLPDAVVIVSPESGCNDE